MQPLIVPTVHLNGTSREGLVEQWRNVVIAAQGLYDALRQASPHGRDYYPQSQTAANEAICAHSERMIAVERLRTEAVNHAIAIQDQE